MWNRNDRRAPASRITPSTTFESYFSFAGRQANVPSGKFNGCSTGEDSSGFALSFGSIYFLALLCGRPARGASGSIARARRLCDNRMFRHTLGMRLK